MQKTTTIMLKSVNNNHRSKQSFYIYVCLIFLLGLCFTLYTGQIQFALMLWSLFVGTYLILRLWTSNNIIVIDLYSCFFFVYNLLVLLTHIELIHNPLDDFYVHNDAAWSFYRGTMDYILPSNWSELFNKTLLDPLFSHYPLSAYIMGAVGKIGQDFGVQNLRLFMRMISPVFGAMVIAVMTNCLSQYGINDRKIWKLIIPFGFFTYLYETSAIFTRDVHVCLAYVFAFYVCVCPKIRGRLILFVLLFFVAFGFRPENGYLYLLYPLTYYFSKYKSKIGGIIYFVIIALMLSVFIFFEDTVMSGLNTFDYYDEHIQQENNSNGLFMQVFNLPFPFNKLFIFIYVVLMPFPVTSTIIGDGRTLLNLPYMFAPFLMSLIFITTAYYVFFSKNNKYNVKYYILVSLLVFLATIYGSIDLRRAFPAIPGLYLCYCLIKDKCPQRVGNNVKNILWPIIACLNIIFILYTLRTYL